MTFEEFLQIAQSAGVRFELLTREADTENYTFQLHVEHRELLPETFLMMIRDHAQSLFQGIRLNMTCMCVSPEDHRASWSWVPLPPHFKSAADYDYERCERCAEYRRTAPTRSPDIVISLSEHFPPSAQ